ncbi:MAG: M12 family metallo-peptidase [Weeksellaceae bacterium]|jgi:hypothetical protein|nr:M12 family metallo-peptidase [Weeksellaceae bacterium]
MKKISFLFLLLCSAIVFGQTKSVAQKVQSLEMTNQKFNDYQLFTKNNDASKISKYLSSATDVTVLDLNEGELNRLMSEASEFISLTVPYLSESIEIKLYKQSVLANSFFATDEIGNNLDYAPGEYYRGIVNGNYQSIVAISFFENDVIGVISTPETGNIVVGKSVDEMDFVSYVDENLLGENPFVCGVDEISYNQQIEEQISFDPSIYHTPTTTNCVKIYYEIAYAPFVNRGKNIQNTLNWITGIQNNIGTLYDNDNINLVLDQVRIWTYADPYTGDYGDNLYLFQETVKDFEADLAHLVNFPSTTSVAFLDSLCTDWNYAYSGVSMSYAQVPTYSWTIMAMTHEMGHALGSPHTHACAWNGNNTAIDGCGPAAGYGEGCNASIPSSGGTIMSYCHLTNVGINLSLGFGEQPAQLIRTTVDSKPCLSSDCEVETAVCTYAIKEIKTDYLGTSSIQITLDDEYSPAWKYQIVPFGTAINPNDWTDTTTNPFVIPGIPPHQYYEIYVINVCEDGSTGAMKRGILLSGDFCDGIPFVDTGGTSANYSNDEHWTKTFYPSQEGGKVRLSFTKIGLQPNVDFMYVYNGSSTSSPLFSGGIITGGNNPGPTFQSTDSSGAITVEFHSDSSGNAYGWEGVVDCDSLGTEDLSDSFGIHIFPNPTSDVLHINSDKLRIESIQLLDSSGKNVLNHKVNGLNTKINVHHLPKGVYVLTIKTQQQTVNKKIIKN